MKNKLEENMANIKVKKLSAAEREQVWQAVAARTQESKGVLLSWPLILKTNPMLQVFIAILIILGGSVATVQAADKARPGDWLFPVDRVIENVNIRLATKEKKDELKIKYAQERIVEVESLIEETEKRIVEQQVLPGTNVLPSSEGDDSESRAVYKQEQLRIEDKERLEQAFQIAFDYVVSVQAVLPSQGEITDDLLDQLLSKVEYGASYFPEGIELEMELEDHDNKVEVKFAPVDSEDEYLPTDFNQKPVYVEIKSEDQGDRKIEIEGFTESGKVHYKVEDDGPIEIEYESSQIDDGGKILIPYGDDGIEVEVEDDNSESEAVDDDSTSQAVVYLKEIKVQVQGSQAEVKIDFVGGEHKFVLNYVDTDSLIKQIADRYKADVNLVKSIMEIEFESEEVDIK